MATNTENLKLFKYDVEKDKKQTFNIKKSLNDNWDKIDESLALLNYQSDNVYKKGAWVVGTIDGKKSIYESLADDNINNILTNKTMWKKISLGSSGLEVCDIGMALFVDETKGLRRRLNGQIVDINTNTQGFLTRLKQITTLYPSLLCTEKEWQTIKSASKLGQCGKFVFNYSGVEITSVRIPAVININGLVDMSNAGLIKDESLPNITGSVRVWNANDSTGAFNGVNDVIYGRAGGNVRDTGVVTFDASRSSSAYQDNAPVQQEAIQYPYFIQIATGQEAENNIKDTLELNNPFTFGMNIYFKGEMENISWLKSANQQNLKALYPDFYNWVLTNANAGKDGFKLSTASDITDYDFVINTTDETFRLPLKNGQETALLTTAPVVGNGYTLGLTDGTNTRDLSSSNSGNYGGFFVGLYNNGTGKVGDDVTNRVGSMPNDKVIGVSTESSKSGLVAQLSDATIPPNYNLYYFVGETVKNPNLIDAGRIGENLVNKLDTPPRYPVEISDKSLMPSWYVVYNDGWCEQGGVGASGTGDKVVTLLKPYLNTNYSVLTQARSGSASYGAYYSSVQNTKTTTANFTLSVGSNFDGGFTWTALGYIK